MSRLSWSFHTHSAYCDGQGSLRDVAEAAMEAGLTDLGFSSHAPLPFETDWTMPLERLSEYQEGVAALRIEYGDRINLWMGAEIDYVPLATIDRFQRENILTSGFDYFVGSVHFLGKGDPPRSFDGEEAEFQEILTRDYGGQIREMTGDYFRRVTRLAEFPGVAVVGHFDVIKRWNATKTYFTGDETWYRDQVHEALDAFIDSGILIELNTAGWRKGLGEPYPADWILAACRDRGISVTVSADAHTPEQLIWGYDRAVELLNSLRIVPVNPASVITTR